MGANSRRTASLDRSSWRIATKSGFELTATADHKVLTTEGWLPVEHLVPGVHKLLIQSGEGKFPNDRTLPFKPSNVHIGETGRRRFSIFQPNGHGSSVW